MVVEKKIEITEEADVKIKGVTLLPQDVYEACSAIIPDCGNYWWLLPSNNQLVYVHGYFDKTGTIDYNSRDQYGVRPTLILETSDFEIGDEFNLPGYYSEYTWTVISEKYALCNDIVGRSPFRSGTDVPDVSNYGKSDIKKYLTNWVKQADLIFD